MNNESRKHCFRRIKYIVDDGWPGLRDVERRRIEDSGRLIDGNGDEWRWICDRIWSWLVVGDCVDEVGHRVEVVHSKGLIA